MTHVVLVRHGPVLAAPGLCYGRLDIEPDAVPARLIGDAVAAHAGAGPVWTSPSRRCRVVADEIARRTGAELHVDPRLLELDFGAWEGHPWSAVPRAELDPWAADPDRIAPPCGETGASLVARVAAFRRELTAGIVVSHGGPLKVLAALLRGRPVDLSAPAPPVGSVETILA